MIRCLVVIALATSCLMGTHAQTLAPVLSEVEGPVTVDDLMTLRTIS